MIIRRAAMILGVALALLLVLSTIGACAQQTTAPAPASTKAPAAPSQPAAPSSVPASTAIKPQTTSVAAPPATAKAIRWKAASPYAPSGGSFASFQWFLQQIETRTNGRIQIDRFYGGELGGTDVLIDVLGSGTIDCAAIFADATVGRNPLMAMDSVPLLSMSRPDWAVYVALQKQNHPAALAETNKLGIVVKAAWASLPHDSVISKKPIRKLADLTGIRIMSHQSVGPLLKKFGAVPVWMGNDELYTSMSSGLLDAVSNYFESHFKYKLYEVSKYLTTDIKTKGGGVIYECINKKSWEALPADLQTILNGIAADCPSVSQAIWNDPATLKQYEDTFRKAGLEFVPFPSEDNAKLENEAVNTLWADWVKKTGGPAQEVIDFYVKTSKKAVADYPKGFPTVPNFVPPPFKK